MQTLRRTAIALVVAVALVVIAGLGVFRQLRADARGPVPTTAALDAPIVPGATLVALGFQTVFSSFFVSILGMRRK